MKIQIPLDQSRFQDFKAQVDQTFPNWQVRRHSPNVYLTHRGEDASVFTLNDRVFTVEEVQTLTELADQAKPSELNTRFEPVATTQHRRYASQKQIAAKINGGLGR